MQIKGKRVLVTGADGFIGSHLTEMLYKSGASHVRALSFYNSFNDWGWLESVDCKKNIEVVCGDIRDSNFCMLITKDIDVVFHLAALIAIPYSYVAPGSYLDTNVNGTLNICQAAKVNKVERILITSTSEVYGTAKYVPIDENHPLQPQSPYSASKIGADAIAMSFFNSFGLPVIITRPFNTYGPRQSARAVIPSIISQLASGKQKISLGDVTPTRDFNYVQDTCRGFLAMAECDDAIGKTINIGSNSEISIRNTFELIKEIMGSSAELVVDETRIRPEKSEVFRLWCDNSLIHSLTGFKSEIGIKEGLKKTVEWFTSTDNNRNYKSDIYNV